MPRTVVLRHDLSDGSHHYDWLIEPMGSAASADDDATAHPDRRELIAWRLPEPPHSSAALSMTADRLPPHRRRYLDYEGPVSGNRGSVVRIARGEAEVLSDTPDRFEARGRIADRAFRLDATPSPASGEAAWRLTVIWE
ncbi:MAG: hypothetical protein ACF8R9_15015 [Phycisphaerales bacterium JB054]